MYAPSVNPESVAYPEFSKEGGQVWEAGWDTPPAGDRPLQNILRVQGKYKFYRQFVWSCLDTWIVDG